MTTTNVAMLEAALLYVSRGWAVLPIAPGRKHPLTPNGVKDATTDVTTIRAWWGREWPEANVGIATGAVSGLVVLDVDKRHGGLETLAALEAEGKLPATRTHRTPGEGFHFFFRHPGTPVKNRSGFMPGLDLKADGGYVVAPPSRFEGKPYAWDREKGGDNLAEAPAWLFAEEKPAAQASATAPGATGKDEKFRGTPRKPTMEFIAFGAAPGTWHDAFYRAAMDLKQNCFPLEEARELLAKATGHLDETDVKQLEDVYLNRTPQLPPNEGLFSETGALSHTGLVSHAGLVSQAGLQEATWLLGNTGALSHTGVPGPTGEAAPPVVIRAGELSGKTLSHLANKELVNGEATGFSPLDRLLKGKRLGELTLTHAEAKTGKNTFWHFLMHHWLKRGIPCGYASREMSPADEVHPNLLSLEFQENAFLAEMTTERQAKYADKLNEWKLYYAGFNGGYGYFPQDKAFDWMMECYEKHGVRYFWMDHLHYMLANPDEHRDAIRFVHALKPFIKAHGFHVDLVVQPTKLMEGQRLSLNSLKGGSHIGQTADNLICMEIMERNVRKVSLTHARSKLAEPGSFYIQYDPQTMCFVEVAEEPVPQPATPYNVTKLWDGSDKRI